MINNIFYDNSAKLGGALIYFNNKLLSEYPNKSNKFEGNHATFAIDFYTFPVRVNFNDDKNFKSWINKSSYALKIVPGISQINLHFKVVDYYGQTIKSMQPRLIL